MDVEPLEIEYYETASGRCPFEEWLSSLDKRFQSIVDARLARVKRGLLGDCAPVGTGVYELRIDVGPGLRAYYGRIGRALIILLHGGGKDRQTADIERAHAYWREYIGRTWG